MAKKTNSADSAPAQGAEQEAPKVSYASDKTFENALKLYSTSSKKTMEAARLCAEMGLQHFHDHGQVSYLQRFLDAIPKNYGRPAAFKAWLVAHCPITMKDGKFLKDKAREEREGKECWKLEQAMAKPFWEFKPDRSDILFAETDVIKRFRDTINYFHREKVKPAEPTALEALAKIEKALAPFIPAEDEADAKAA